MDLYQIKKVRLSPYAAALAVWHYRVYKKDKYQGLFKSFEEAKCWIMSDYQTDPEPVTYSFVEIKDCGVRELVQVS